MYETIQYVEIAGGACIIARESARGFKMHCLCFASYPFTANVHGEPEVAEGLEVDGGIGYEVLPRREEEGAIISIEYLINEKHEVGGRGPYSRHPR